MLKIIVVAALWLLAATPALAQIQSEPILFSGACDPKSGVTIDNRHSGAFGCDVVVITRSQRGAVLIQFTDKRGDDGRILGFSGALEGKQGFGADAVQTVVVERLYLAGGADPIPVSRGTCIMNWSGLQRTGGKLTSVVCGAAGRVQGADIKAIAAINVQ